MNKTFKYEMHCHTAEFGWCAKVPTEILVPEHAKAGYQGICITNHYIDFAFRKMKAKDWTGKIDFYLDGYRKAKSLAKHYDMDVILGLEIRFAGDSYNDFLVYGMDEDFLYKYPELYTHTPESFKAFCEEHDLLIFQAHPFRPYCNPEEAKFLDGYEILNANVRSDNNNHLTKALQKKTQLLGIAGSDYHQLEDIDRSGCIFYERVRDGKELVRVLKAHRQKPCEPRYEIIRK